MEDKKLVEKEEEQKMLTLSATKDDKEYIFSYPEGATYNNVKEVLTYMRDHAVIQESISVQEIAKDAIEKADFKEDNNS